MCALPLRPAPCAQATVHGTGLAEGVGGMSVINHFYGRDDIALGAYHGNVGDPAFSAMPEWTRKGRGVYVQHLLDHFESPVRSRDDVPNATVVYRSQLAAADDGGVTVVVVGHMTNVLNLLNSGPDAHSKYTGVELVRRKVRITAQRPWLQIPPRAHRPKVPPEGAASRHCPHKSPRLGCQSPRQKLPNPPRKH